MRFLTTAHTDIGISKKINQDAFCVKVAKTPFANIAFAVLCDGMGGLKSGEYASALVVNAFSRWFEGEFAETVSRNMDLSKIAGRWDEIVRDQGQKILSYGDANGISLGTTVTAILIVNNVFVGIHVGDSRLYKISRELVQVTRDQTVAAYEIEHGRMTEEEAKNDRRSSVLLQCVGASKTIVPEIVHGTVEEQDAFLLCSDGFRHKVEGDEIFGVVAPHLLTSEAVMQKSLVDLVELNKSRRETDNITAVLIKAIH